MNNSDFIPGKYLYAAAFLIGCFFVGGCENDMKQIKALTDTRAQIEEARNIESYLSQDGIMKAKLTAPLMLRVLPASGDSTYVEFPRSLHVDFYNDSTKIESWLDSRYGKYFETQDKVYLRDRVIVINIKGDTLRAPELWWDQKAKLFYTDSVAEYHRADKHIFGGRGMVATQDMSEVTFKMPTGNVQTNKNGAFQ